VASIPARAPSHPRTACDGIRGGRLESRPAVRNRQGARPPRPSTSRHELRETALPPLRAGAAGAPPWRASRRHEPLGARERADRRTPRAPCRRTAAPPGIGRRRSSPTRAGPSEPAAAPRGPEWSGSRPQENPHQGDGETDLAERERGAEVRRPQRGCEGARRREGPQHHPEVPRGPGHRWLAYRHLAHRLSRPPAS